MTTYDREMKDETFKKEFIKEYDKFSEAEEKALEEQAKYYDSDRKKSAGVMKGPRDVYEPPFDWLN